MRLASAHTAIELVNNTGDISSGFVKGRDAMVFVDSRGACIVSGKGQGKIVVVLDEQGVKIGRSAADVLVGFVAVADAKFTGCGGHELHEAACAGRAYGAWIAAAFSFDDAGKQVNVEIVVAPSTGEDFTEVGLTEFGICGRG